MKDARTGTSLRNRKTFSAKRFLVMMFSVIFLLVMILHTVLIGANNHVAVTLVAVAGFVGLVFLALCLRARADRLTQRNMNTILPVVLLLFFAFAFYTATCMRVELPSDTDIVYEAAADILENGSLQGSNEKMQLYYPDVGLYTNADYFCRYTNNILLLVILVGLYAAGGLFGIKAGTGDGQFLAIGFTAFSVTLTILFTCLIIRHILKKNFYVLLALGLCVVCAPFYYSIPNFYTDILVLCPLLGACYLFVLHVEAGRWWTLVVCALLFAVAVELKPTAGIYLVALVIFSCFNINRVGFRAFLLKGLVFMGTFIVFMLFYTLWYRNCGWFDFSREAELGLPFQLWMCFGSHGNGSYSLEDVRFATSVGPGERSDAVWGRIGENYSGYTLDGLLGFWREKLLWTWNDGRFEGAAYTMWPLDTNWTVAFTQPVGLGYIFTYWYGQVYVMLLYLGTLASAVLSVLRKKADALFLCNLGIFGTMLYLQVFEAAPRRALIAVPLLLVGLLSMIQLISDLPFLRRVAMLRSGRKKGCTAGTNGEV